MYWAKTHAHCRYHLASSGLMNLSIRELKFRPEDLEITADTFYGYPPLRKAIADKEGVDPETVFTTLGTSLANHLAMAALIDPGDEILIEHPTYELLLSTARYLGADVRRFERRPENDFLIDPGELRKHASSRTKLIILTNLHNPSSAYTDEDTLGEIGTIAGERGATVLVDEVYLDAVFDRNHRSCVHLGPQFISTNSLTKIYGLSGLRCGWVLAPAPLVKRMWRLSDLFHVNLPHLTEQMSVMALQQLDHLLPVARSIFTENHQTLSMFLGMQKKISGMSPGSGTVFFPRLLAGTVEQLASILTDRFETSIVPGKYFEMPDHFRIGLGLQPADFREGLRRVGQALEML